MCVCVWATLMWARPPAAGCVPCYTAGGVALASCLLIALPLAYCQKAPWGSLLDLARLIVIKSTYPGSLSHPGPACWHVWVNCRCPITVSSLTLHCELSKNKTLTWPNAYLTRSPICWILKIYRLATNPDSDSNPNSLKEFDIRLFFENCLKITFSLVSFLTLSQFQKLCLCVLPCRLQSPALSLHY